MSSQARPLSIRWEGGVDGHLVLIDQTELPARLVYLECRDVDLVWEAIRSLRVRGAPAIGIAAAYGVCLAAQTAQENVAAMRERVAQASDYLASSRPTAVNLFWALGRLQRAAEEFRGDDAGQLQTALLAEARAVHDEDRAVCRAIGAHGAHLLVDGSGVLTHCNTGSLAASEYGTALSVFFTAHDQGKRIHVYVDETRPLLQGSRLTCWELMQHGVPATLICDSMAALVMRQGRVDAVITGADRIVANGDTANKIGTYGLALLAKAHEIPFYVAAPASTFDLAIVKGDQIPIEQRAAEEVSAGFGRQTAPEGVNVYNPAFDVTPAALIRAIITERGVIEPVSAERIAAILQAGEPKP